MNIDAIEESNSIEKVGIELLHKWNQNQQSRKVTNFIAFYSHEGIFLQM